MSSNYYFPDEDYRSGFGGSSMLTVGPARAPVWKKSTGGALLAVDLNEIKTFTARPVNDTAWDAELTSFARTAQRLIESDLRADLTPTVWIGKLPRFFTNMRLEKRPFIAVDQIDYVDRDGVIQTLATDQYQAHEIDQFCGYVVRGDSVTWPSTASRPDAVRISVRSGFAVDEDDEALGHPELPEDIKHALLMTIASLEMARGETQASSGSNTTVYAMKNSQGGSLIPQEAMHLMADFKLMRMTFA